MRAFRIMSVSVAMLLFGVSVSTAGLRSAEDFGRADEENGKHTVHLKRLRDCAEVMDYMAEAAVNILVEQRYGKGWRAFPWYMDGSGGASPESYTTTNVQEAGVDEMDIVKTNGRNIYYLNHQELMCLKSWPAEESSILSRMSFDGYPQGLLLDGDILVVISSIWDYGEDDPRFQAGSRVDLYDVSDPGEPLLLREINLSSWVSGARLINSDLYLILSDWGNLPAEAWELIWRDDLGLPELPAEASDEERERAAAGLVQRAGNRTAGCLRIGRQPARTRPAALH